MPGRNKLYFSQSVSTGLGTRPASRSVGSEDRFRGLKSLEREIDPSLASGNSSNIRLNFFSYDCWCLDFGTVKAATINSCNYERNIHSLFSLNNTCVNLVFVPCIAGLCIENQHCALGFVNVFITNAAPTQSVGKHNTVQHLKPAHRAHKFTIPEAVHSCLSFHVLTKTKTLRGDGT
jgi:hypothetical protein